VPEATHKTIWRSFGTAAWLGWQIESNWTDPLLFALYSIVKPLSMAGIVVVLYAIVTRGDFSSPVFASMYVGNAFYGYVSAVMVGMVMAVADDRERYQTLRSVYVAPVDVRFYLAGRGVARFLIATISVVITLAFGALFLRVKIRLGAVDWPLLLVTFAIGIVMLAMMGLALSGLALLLPDSSWSMGEATAGALFLFTGAIFPIDVLPGALRPLGYAMPITYWLELLRRALLGPGKSFATFANWSDGALLRSLSGLTLLLGAAALICFRLCDFQARERGLIDRTSGH
jgi:ABC-2 type transport system permease protein